MARPFSRHGRYDACNEYVSSEAFPSVSSSHSPVSKEVIDVKSYTMFERPKTSHGRRASTGNSVYQETKPVRRDYQYPDRIEQISWEENQDKQLEKPGMCDQEFLPRNVSVSEPARVETCERAASRRGHSLSGQELVDRGLKNTDHSSLDDQSYFPFHAVSSSERSKNLLQKSSRRHSSVHTTSVFDVPILRPRSSLSKFQPLPSIGTKIDESGEMHRLVVHTDKLNLDSELQNNRQQTNRETRSLYRKREAGDESHNFQMSENLSDEEKQSERGEVECENVEKSSREREVCLSPEPGDQEERLLLAVKLPPDGQRFQRYFRPASTLRQVVLFAESVAGVKLAGCSVACNAPRRVFTDFDQTCEQVGLQDRTLLYFEQTQK